MPILDVDVVLAENERSETCWAQHIADAAGTIFETEPGRTWARMHNLMHSDYAENEMKDSLDIRPVFVSVLKAKTPPIDVLRIEVLKLMREIARIADR